ncbi:hypothetical protein BpHYR1_021295 [Brachionus plicatilis]|uniref:Uncharacterized protein n=1 Tax=Brachionus plicatilis TaxID=10195 RepID=A0A3M7SDP7_BRAPC|nr:hypothetical protein BpHYR1_021295 [Brachionus plicatilis]
MFQLSLFGSNFKTSIKKIRKYQAKKSYLFDGPSFIKTRNVNEEKKHLSKVVTRFTHKIISPSYNIALLSQLIKFCAEKYFFCAEQTFVCS